MIGDCFPITKLDQYVFVHPDVTIQYAYRPQTYRYTLHVATELYLEIPMEVQNESMINFNVPDSTEDKRVSDARYLAIRQRQPTRR